MVGQNENVLNHSLYHSQHHDKYAGGDNSKAVGEAKSLLQARLFEKDDKENQEDADKDTVAEAHTPAQSLCI